MTFHSAPQFFEWHMSKANGVFLMDGDQTYPQHPMLDNTMVFYRGMATSGLLQHNADVNLDGSPVTFREAETHWSVHLKFDSTIIYRSFILLSPPTVNSAWLCYTPGPWAFLDNKLLLLGFGGKSHMSSQSRAISIPLLRSSLLVESITLTWSARKKLS